MEPWIGAKNDRTADSTRRDRCRPRQESGASPIPELRGRNISRFHGCGQSEPGKSLGGPIILAPAHAAWAVPDFRKNVGKVRLEDPVQGKIIDKNFAFTFRATDPGQLKVTFTDTTGGKYEEAADVTFS